MSDTKPKRGRSLRPQDQDTEATEGGGTVDPQVEPEADKRMAPDPDPVERVPRRPGHVAPSQPSGLVWNHTAGIRIAVLNIPAVDADGNEVKDGAGLTVYAVKHNVQMFPGLNLVPVELWSKLRPNLGDRIKAGELQSLGTDPRDITEARLVKAIGETGHDAPLKWLMERERRITVLDALEAQRQTIAPEARRVG